MRWTAFTPGSFCAALPSIDLISAAPWGHRRIFPWRSPLGAMSYVYFARPVTFAGPSTRGCSLPTTDSFASAPHGSGSSSSRVTSISLTFPGYPTFVFTLRAMVASLPELRRRVLDGVEDPVVGAAPADVARDPLLDVVQGRIGDPLQEGLAGHHHPRRAEAALQRVVGAEALLQGME